MGLNINDAAIALEFSTKEVLEILTRHGVKNLSENSFLTISDIEILKGERKKRVELQKEKKSESVGGNENRRLESMERYFGKCKIFIDTCSLMESSIDKFIQHAVPIIEKTNSRIIIPTRVINELEKHSGNNNDKTKQEKANHALKVLVKLNKNNLIEIKGEKHDNFADNVFQVVFTKFRMQYNLLLITQDRALTNDILNLNSIESVKAKRVYSKKIDMNGFFSDINKKTDSKEHSGKSKESTENNRNSGQSTKKGSEQRDIPMEEMFALSSTITDVPKESLGVVEVPGANGIVYAEVNTKMCQIELDSEIASGGEGVIYTTNTIYVAKIYKKEKLDKRRYEKIKLMISKSIKCDGICYPVACLYNDKRQFIGYLMPVAEGEELQKSLFIKPLFLKKFPSWKKRDTVELCVTILEKIKYLHDRNIIMGDINPCNILVVSPKKIYFVDTDSYQIEGFPCPVGTINYTAPEIQRKTFETFLRSIGNENFAVATLLFMIMLPGKPPYSQQGGESPVENIIKMDFSYSFKENRNYKTPDGPWKFIWSHLTYDIKEAFYNTFRKEGDYSTEDNRLSVDEWLKMFGYYRHLLDSGKFGEQDEMSLELYPTRHKKHISQTYIKCDICKKEEIEDKCRNGICKECLDKGEAYNCRKCGKELVYTNYQKFIKNAKKFEVCPDCHKKGNQVYKRIVCTDCGKRFELSVNDYDSYKKMGYNLPKRCATCRANRKSTGGGYSKPTSDTRSSHTYNTSNSTTKTYETITGSKRKKCFLTTVVCESFGKNDNCYELELLRDFRDDWLEKQYGGKELIEEYYKIAPAMVSYIEKSPVKKIICDELWNVYIRKCIKLIEEKEFEKCKDKYIDMVDYVKKIKR